VNPALRIHTEDYITCYFIKSLFRVPITNASAGVSHNFLSDFFADLLVVELRQQHKIIINQTKNIGTRTNAFLKLCSGYMVSLLIRIVDILCGKLKNKRDCLEKNS
jgi:hypothetical protein